MSAAENCFGGGAGQLLVVGQPFVVKFSNTLAATKKETNIDPIGKKFGDFSAVHP